MTKVTFGLLRVATILSLAVLAVAAVDARVVVRWFPTDEARAALAAFQDRVDAYAAMHRRLAVSVPLLGWRHDRDSETIERAYLSAAIRAARSTARRGDIFTPEA
jgi:hypothetical protein